MKNFLSQKKKRAILAAVTAGVCLGSFQAEAAPEFFDWRLNNPTDSTSGTKEMSIVSPVEKQDRGVCWTFGSFSSYESSWMKQLLAAQAAGYNVDVSRNIFSKYYMAWTAFMPPLDNANDGSIYDLMGSNNMLDLYTRGTNNLWHPVYDQGGYAAKSIESLLRYGAVDANAASLAETEELQNSIAESIKTSANQARMVTFAKDYLTVLYGKTLDSNLPKTVRDKMLENYKNSLTDEEIAATLEKSFENSTYRAVLSTVTPKGRLHDTYLIKNYLVGNPSALTEEQIAKLKEMIQTEGVVMVAHYAAQDIEGGVQGATIYKNTGEVNPFGNEASHMESLVGWDDNYVFQNYANSDGSPVRGAFIMRNSWGEDKGINGYGYLAYQDTSIAELGFFNATLDSRRYTIDSSNTPAIDATDYIVGGGDSGTQNIANTFRATTDSGQFLKAVMFYASEENMPYEIIVREGTTPGEGTILTQQSGTFGADGTAKWGGYRTVDLNNFVFLAKDKNYTVEVRTTSPEGNTVYVAMMAGQNVEQEGASYTYDEDLKTWVKTDQMRYEDDDTSTENSTSEQTTNGTLDEPTGLDTDIIDRSEYKRVYLFTVARNKESAEANGGDFTVSWLDDTNSDGNSIINLGSSTELYGTDYLNPDRKTLSNMTVDLGQDVFNFYRGTIIGEGSVTKTGLGFLALSGANTYTGGTFVNNGRLEIDGSIVGNAWTTDNGTISGSGIIGGTLYNYNRAVAGNLIGYGNLTMGGLESSGELVAQNPNTKFVVNGAANVEGSTVVAYNTLPDENISVVEAQSVTGNLKNSSTPIAISGMMSSTAAISGNNVIATARIANNLGDLDEVQAKTFDAVKNISDNLRNNSRKSELYYLVNFDAANARNALSEIGSTDSADMMALAQRSSVVNRVISDRMSSAFVTQNFDAEVPANNFADGDENSLVLPISVKVPVQVENNAWIKFTKNWGELKGGADYHGQAISGGYDHAIGENWRMGFFVSYNATGLGAKSANGNIYDTRFGLYGGYHKNADDAYIYIDGGKVRNKLQRHIPTLGLSTEANYNGTVFEIGGEYKHDLQPEKIWHVSPFINLQFSSLKQNSYGETGAGIFNQHVNSKRNSYFAGQLGVEFRRNFTRGDLAARIGVKHAFTGADPELNFSYEGGNNFYTMKSNQDKTHFIMSLSGTNEFATNWILGGDLAFQKGAHDRDLSASVMLSKVW